MSQFDDRLNEIMKGLLLDSSHDKDKEDDEKKDEKEKGKDKDKGPKENPYPWDRGGINEKKECPEGQFWCSVDKKCKPE